MQYTVEKKPKSQIVISIQTTPEEMAGFTKDALRKLSKEISIKGFRPGKVPEDVIRKHVGDSDIFATALDIALPKLYAEVVTKESLQPLYRPKVEVTKREPLEFTMTVDVFPEVTVGDYAKISVAHQPKEVTAQSVDDALAQLQRSFALYETADRPAKDQDRVEIDFEGFDTQGQPIAGAKSTNHPLVIGGKMFVPGFEEALIGMKAGDKKEFTVTFPKDYHSEELKGKPVKFHVTLHKIEEQKLPPLDDAFAQKITGHKIDKITALKEEVKQSLMQKADQEARQETEEQILDHLVKLASIDIPTGMIAEEQAYLVQDFMARLQEQGMDLPKFLGSQKTTEEAFTKKMTETAEKRITMRLALNAVAQREKIEPSDEEMAKGTGQSDQTADQKELLRVHLRIQKALQYLFDQATAKKK